MSGRTNQLISPSRNVRNSMNITSQPISPTSSIVPEEVVAPLKLAKNPKPKVETASSSQFPGIWNFVMDVPQIKMHKYEDEQYMFRKKGKHGTNTHFLAADPENRNGRWYTKNKDVQWVRSSPVYSKLSTGEFKQNWMVIWKDNGCNHINF